MSTKSFQTCFNVSGGTGLCGYKNKTHYYDKLNIVLRISPDVTDLI